MSAETDQIRPAYAASGRVARRLTVTSRSVLLAVSVVVGGVVLALAVGGLREAHLYRQRTGEGLKFVWVGVGFVVANGLLGVASIVSVRLASEPARPIIRRAFIGLAVAIVVALFAADVVALWVETRGDRCIGACG